MKNYKKIHFIGVSGIGVSGVAYLSIMMGFKITGSSIERNELVERLVDLGMRYFEGHREDNIDGAELIVRSAAVSDENPEVVAAKKRGIPVILYSEYLGMLMADKIGIAVAGTHGKTTTTSMLANILYDGGVNPTVVCGGIISRFASNALYGKGEYFVAEACEYRESFLNLKKKYAVITNVEPEHLDYYKNSENLLLSFRKFILQTDKDGVVVVNGDDENILNLSRNVEQPNVVRVGYNSKNDFIIEEPVSRGGVYSYRLVGRKKYSSYTLGLELNIPGKFNILNSSLAAVLSILIGIEADVIKKSLANYTGTMRRIERIGDFKRNPVFSDYGHHPTEIRATIEAIKEYLPDRKVVLIFQPHQYSRTLFFFDEFVNSLSLAPVVVLTEIYRQRDPDDIIGKVNSRKLYEAMRKRGVDVYYLDDMSGLWNFLDDKINDDGYVLLFMGAGSIDEYARSYFK